MPELIFAGPEGRLEGRFSPPPRPRAPVALILHPHPQGGGTMNNRIVQAMYQTFVKRGFATLRCNFRGVGKSQGTIDNGVGELSDAASALDWVQQIHPRSEEHTSELQSLMRNTYAVFWLKKKATKLIGTKYNEELQNQN